MLACGRRSLQHRGDKIGLTPAADTVDRILRNIRGIERPEWRRNRNAAAEHGTIVLIDRRVTRRAAAGVEDGSSPRRIGDVSWQRANGNRLSDEPEQARSNDDGGERNDS